MPVAAPHKSTSRHRRPRVLLLTTSYPLHRLSVSGLFVERLAQALSAVTSLYVLAPADAIGSRPERGEPVVGTFRYAPCRKQVLAHGAGGIPAALAANGANLLLVPLFVLAMLIACWRRSNNAELIHANWSVCGIVAGIVGRLRRIPVVVTLRGEDANRVKQHSFRAVLRVCAHLCDAVVTVSDAMETALRCNVPTLAPKLMTIPNGVAPDFLDIPLRQGADGVLRLLCVASLIPRKDVATLIRALAHLPPTYTLTVVGEGNEANALATLASRLKLSARIRWLPFQPPARIADLLAESDAFVLPSLAEGRPNVILEAFAAARPVVACDIDGVRELIGNEARGLLYAPGDEWQLAAHLMRLDDKGIRTALGERGRQFILDQGLTWERAAERYAALFERLIDGKRHD